MVFLGVRFPRVERINWTKPCNEAISISELIELNEEKTPPFVRGDEKDPDNARDNIDNLKKKQKSVAYSKEQAAIAQAKADGIRISGGRTSRKIISSARGADVSEVSVISEAFGDLSFLVMATDEGIKNQLEVKIHELGGKFLQNFTKDVSFVIGVSGENLDKLEEKYRSNRTGHLVRPIVKPGWISRCRAEKSKEELQWRDMIFAPPEMEKEMLKDNDRFGDPWIEETTPEGLLQCVEKVRHEKKKNLPPCTDEDALKLIDTAVKNGFAALRGRSFFVPKELKRAPRATVLLVRALGGTILDDMQAGAEIIVHQSCLNEWNEVKIGKGGLFESCEVRSSEWVENLFNGVRSKHSEL